MLEFCHFKSLEIEKKYPNLKKENYIKYCEKINSSLFTKFKKQMEDLNRKYLPKNLL